MQPALTDIFATFFKMNQKGQYEAESPEIVFGYVGFSHHATFCAVEGERRPEAPAPSAGLPVYVLCSQRGASH